ncbi:MAG: putative toxin-antitoxin system toxin component, PIN family [Acidobacteria bacterium]|nr:MAG: putative toxin-antitoxin system toxin component, PIN family [Acidobacteriota bacterium]
MKSRDRFVFDTSVVVSAVLISSSHPAKAFRKARQIGDILLSLPVAEELNEVLGRGKFDRYLTREDRERFLAAFIHAAKFIEVTERIVACRDPKDDKFLELAVSGQAACIVTGDHDLLALHPFRGIPILSVEQFLKSF